SAATVVLAAVKLAEYGDVIAVRTRLGGMFVGTLLLAGATSLPELLTNINALRQGVPDLAVGSVFGSSMFNMFLLGVLDLIHWRKRILRLVAMKHALTASLANMLMAAAVFFILADISLQIGWVGVDSLALILIYIAGVRLIQRNSGGPSAPEPDEAEIDPQMPSLLRAGIGFAAASGALVLVTPCLVRSSVAIAEITGLSTGFVGALLVAMVTSLPEMVTVIAATRIGAYDLAVGNLFGSNAFNMLVLGLTDFFYLPGRFLGSIDSSFALVGLLGLLLTTLGLVGNLARLERRIFFLELDAAMLILGYVGGMALLYSRGIGL
ncbi:MAG: sodium:calcium antiporter, partial [Chloroflexi bacterium]|nr:sodium:calcium antiporter [Chloroflexota bacterium]